MNKFTKFLYAFLMIAVFTIATSFGQCPPNTWSLNVTINPDQYPEETSWYIMTFFGDTLMQGGTYNNIVDYEPQYASACAPIDSFYFVINDTYGDGVAGSLWGGNDGSVYIEKCGDTIWELTMADFGSFMYDTIYTSGCPPPPPVFGCMDSSYLEYNIAATLDTGMCFTPRIYGCTDSLAYNYVSLANTDIYVDSCMHELELTDLAGNGWAGSSLKIQQATSLVPPLNYQDIGTYTLIDGFDTTFFVNLADVVFWPIPLIQIGLSEIVFAISSDANKIDELPEHEREQSKILRSSVICFEFITSDIVRGSLLYAKGLSIACL